jgi:hypothetical protein
MISVERNDPAGAALLTKAFGVAFVPPFTAWIVWNGHIPLGAYVLNCFTGHDVALTGVVYSPWPISVAREIARQCFVELGVSRVTARTRPSNVGAIRALKAAGFHMESVARDHFGDEDAYVFALLRRDQKLVRA